MFTKLKANYSSLPPEKRKKVVVVAAIAGIALVATGFFFVTPFHTKEAPVKLAGPQKAALSIDNKMLEKSTTTRVDAQDKEIKALRDAIKDSEKEHDSVNQKGLPGQPGAKDTALPTSAQLLGINDQKGSRSSNGLGLQNRNQRPAQPLPPMPLPPQSRHNAVSGNESAYLPPPAPLPPREEIIGSIGRASNDAANIAKVVEDGKKKANPTVYLPPSFMVAHLLTGLNAPVTLGGKSNPVPVLIRVAAPAQLPNDVKMNLSKCFAIGEGVGDLSQERALVRLVNLTCLSKNGQSVIDQPITGFVQDTDSKAGLSGRVVAKFGATIARSFLAGLASGIGSAFAGSQSTNTIGPLGLTSVGPTQLGDIALQGVGKGIATASDEIHKFYMDLARSSLPIIEVGNGKKITLVITKGANLEIKSFPSVSWY